MEDIVRNFTEDEKVTILKDLIAIKSVNDNETEVAEYLTKLLEKYDIHSKIIEVSPNRSNLVAETGSGNPVIAVSGHMDVERVI